MSTCIPKRLLTILWLQECSEDAHVTRPPEQGPHGPDAEGGGGEALPQGGTDPAPADPATANPSHPIQSRVFPNLESTDDKADGAADYEAGGPRPAEEPRRH